MISKTFNCLSLLTLAAFFSACGSLRSTQMNEVSIQDANNSGDVVITNHDIKPKQVLKPKESRTEPKQILADESELVTMFDGYGNKTETRYFKGHPRLQLVQVRTATDETKQILVYGFGTEIVSMPAEFAAIALNASGDEIANIAGLKTTRPFKSSFASFTPTPTPMRSEIPAQVIPVEVQPQIEAEETAKPENPAKETEQPTNERRNLQSKVEIKR